LTKNSPNDETYKLLIQTAKTRADKAIIALGAIGTNSSVKKVQSRLLELGEPSAKKWNMSAVLSSCKGRATRTNSGWELTATGRAELAGIVSKHQPAAPLNSSTDVLRELLPSISNNEVRVFVEEAIGCVENNLLKASVVFIWIGAVAVLHEHIVKTCLPAFNADATKQDAKWRPAKDADGLGQMKESDFLDSLVRIGVIGKNVKIELKHSLDLRNSCGHPNSLQIGESKVLAHIETLVLNVFKKF
jgi:hypothetical protein